MSRASKAAAVARYLGSRSGIPLVSVDKGTNTINAPAPYGFIVTTDASSSRYWAHIKDLPEIGIHAVIRYDKHIRELEDAVVGIRLSTFTTLLETHYNTISDRINNKIKGD